MNAKQTVKWRRSKVLELSSEGRSQSEIARIMQVSSATISMDIQFLRREAKENIRRYIDERLPFEFHKCLVGLDTIVCKMSDIANSAESDSRDILQATSVKMQAYSMKIDLLSNTTVIEKAVQFVENHKTKSTGGTYQNSKVTIVDRLKESVTA